MAKNMDNRVHLNKELSAKVTQLQLNMQRNEELKGGTVLPLNRSGFVSILLDDYIQFLMEGMAKGKNYTELKNELMGSSSSSALSKVEVQAAELQRQNKILIDRVYQLIYMQLFAQVDLYESSPGWENQIGSVFDPSNSYGEVFAEIQKIVERDQQQFFKDRAKKKMKL